MSNQAAVPVALTIAGSDSGGGAGIQADLRTFAALRVFGTSALTLITAQNTQGVTRIEVLDTKLIKAQIDAVMSDFDVRAVKTGALGSVDVIEAVASKVKEHSITNLVIDPVMVSKHGHALIAPDAQSTLTAKLFPLALLVTPNAYEAASILGLPVGGLGAPEETAMALAETGAKNVLLKGGHLSQDSADDYFFDGKSVTKIHADRIAAAHTHGTGCTLSAAIAAYLAHGLDVAAAVKESKRYITGALKGAVQIGKGISPVHHMFEYYSWGKLDGESDE